MVKLHYTGSGHRSEVWQFLFSLLEFLLLDINYHVRHTATPRLLKEWSVV